MVGSDVGDVDGELDGVRVGDVVGVGSITVCVFVAVKIEIVRTEERIAANANTHNPMMRRGGHAGPFGCRILVSVNYEL